MYGIIYVGQGLDDEQAKLIMAAMLYLEMNVSFYFKCPGGKIPAGLAMYDCGKRNCVPRLSTARTMRNDHLPSHKPTTRILTPLVLQQPTAYRQRSRSFSFQDRFGKEVKQGKPINQVFLFVI